MRIFTRYILHEVTTHALLGCGLFTFVLFTKDLAELLELAVRNSAPVPSIAEVVFYTVPVALTYTIPMGVLVGILIGLSRLAADSEITAMRASGIGVWSFLRILSIFVFGAWLLALFNSVYVAPRAQADLARLQDHLKSSQVSFEIKPRVFYEQFPKLVLYVQDVKSAEGAAIWKNVFIADMTNPSEPRITMAQRGILVNEGPNRLHLHLTNGTTQETNPQSPGEYQISTFQQTDLPIQLPQTDSKDENEPPPIGQVKTSKLPAQARKVNESSGWWYLVEYHRRFALPTACIVLALVGIPLGLSSKKGGKSSGFVITILLVFAYYSVSLIGVSLARQGKISPAFGAWLGDIVFFAAGAFLLWRAERRPMELGSWRWLRSPLQAGWAERRRPAFRATRVADALERATSRKRFFSARFPTILDDYVFKDFIFYLALITSSFLILILIFTLFELLGDILRNQVSPLIVGEYLLNVTPYFIYNVAPLMMLLAVLVTFTLLQRSNEITAIKATGISIYRLIIPVMLVALAVSVALFFMDQSYLPYTNQRQDALRSMIKGKPPQTYLNPGRKWILGEHSNIYYYQFFDSDRDQFGNLNVFQFDPATFQLTRRISAARAHWDPTLQQWVCTQGWVRTLDGSTVDSYRTFDVSTFAALSEHPSYFKKEVKQSSEMNYEELRRYIGDLQQSGFDVVRLKVQLQKKLAFPLITLVMAMLAIPFSLSSGKHGALTGVATAVLIALVYTFVSNLFEAMGNISQLPPVLAAWSPDLIFAFVGGYLLLRVPT
jgi:LPS export ABC transporter permease LptF/LPS export ABC transporter permease LptG